MNTSGINPLDVKVLVRPEAAEEKTAGGIIIPDTTRDQKDYAATRGHLLAKGPNAFADWGQGNAPIDGARVLFAQYAGKRFKGDDGESYIVMNDEDVIGVAP